jgi:NAD(P)-dependent dehydrogenase (short-subunit alcohol dehydrogenase family)
MCAVKVEHLLDKTAFITGGASGIGLGIASALLSEGAKVVLTSRHGARLAEALQLLAPHQERVRGICLDVSDRDAMQKAADETESIFGKVHILCNNAGIGIRTKVSEATFNDWDWAVSVNLMGVANGICCFLPRIRSHGDGGHIISTASVSGLAIPRVSSLYATTKAAVVAMMEGLRGELMEANIGVSVYCPGLVRTNIAATEDFRPERYFEPGRSSDAKTLAMVQQNVVAHGMDPMDAGRYVVEGIKQNALFILSHPEFEGAIRERFDAILGSIPCGLQVPAARLRAEAVTLSNPIYNPDASGTKPSSKRE